MHKTLSSFHNVWTILSLLLFVGCTGGCKIRERTPAYVNITVLDVTIAANGDVNTKFEFTDFPGPIVYTTDFPIYQKGKVQLVATRRVNTGPSIKEISASWLNWDYKRIRDWWKDTHPYATPGTASVTTKTEHIVPKDTAEATLLYW